MALFAKKDMELAWHYYGVSNGKVALVKKRRNAVFVSFVGLPAFGSGSTSGL